MSVVWFSGVMAIASTAWPVLWLTDPRADGENESPNEPHIMEMAAHTLYAWLPAGSTMQRAAAADGAPMPRITAPGLRQDHQELKHQYEEPSSRDFLVRSETYLTNRNKAPAVLPPLYGLVSMDIFATPNKLENVMTCLKVCLCFPQQRSTASSSHRAAWKSPDPALGSTP